MRRPPSSALYASCCRSMSVCSGHSGYEFDDIFQQSPSRKENIIGGFSCLQGADRKQEQLLSAPWQESSSRLLGSSSRSFKVSSRGVAFCNGGACSDDEAEDVAAYCKPSPWKLFFRKIRAETKKMKYRARPSVPGFHYDALSYAMNFDDGAWQPPQIQYFEYSLISLDTAAASHHPSPASQNFW